LSVHAVTDPQLDFFVKDLFDHSRKAVRLLVAALRVARNSWLEMGFGRRAAIGDAIGFLFNVVALIAVVGVIIVRLRLARTTGCPLMNQSRRMSRPTDIT
jgi:hypothetical protein